LGRVPRSMVIALNSLAHSRGPGSLFRAFACPFSSPATAIHEQSKSSERSKTKGRGFRDSRGSLRSVRPIDARSGR
jgi:hypothetical protein